ncbi:2-polyprenyl-3-methyl-6-methoxy-1,4-benzoquinone monooxygenase [Salinispirillum sp. LH 10-3-1]|uniref:3-demethoxyubiquinol 3-hydroxylase n=1 Tax=Salinispirillum sp. LH 10-3-1 TaxID=2952525 RepID=A0AB38YIR2_9GAMM
MTTQHSRIDQALIHLDRALKTCLPGSVKAVLPNPAQPHQNNVPMSASERRHAAGLMRVNHTGEVCAQALYEGQASTARLTHIRKQMSAAADEELDHLAWCETRLQELESKPSVLNPLFYGLSFGLGALAGAAGDKYSLGFVAATEDQVSKHLQDHLQELPEQDVRSRAIVKQMLADEQRHADAARQAGGQEFPAPVKQAMSMVAKVMTLTTYRL